MTSIFYYSVNLLYWIVIINYNLIGSTGASDVNGISGFYYPDVLNLREYS